MANWDLKILDSDYIQKTNFKFKLRDSQPTELSGLAITNVNQSYPILPWDNIELNMCNMEKNINQIITAE